jgi:hypothetical protein
VHYAYSSKEKAASGGLILIERYKRCVNRYCDKYVDGLGNIQKPDQTSHAKVKLDL